MLVEYLLDRGHAFFGDAEIFAETRKERPREVISDDVPECVADEVADHEREVYRDEMKVAEPDQKPADHA